MCEVNQHLCLPLLAPTAGRNTRNWQSRRWATSWRRFDWIHDRPKWKRCWPERSPPSCPTGRHVRTREETAWDGTRRSQLERRNTKCCERKYWVRKVKGKEGEERWCEGPRDETQQIRLDKILHSYCTVYLGWWIYCISEGCFIFVAGDSSLQTFITHKDFKVCSKSKVINKSMKLKKNNWCP